MSIHTAAAGPMRYRQIGTLKAENQKRARRILRDRGALPPEDQDPPNARDTLWCGHSKEKATKKSPGGNVVEMDGADACRACSS